MLSAIVLRVVMLCYHTERCYVEYRTKYCYFVLSVAMLSVIILSVVMLGVIILCLVILRVVMQYYYTDSCYPLLLYQGLLF